MQQQGTTQQGNQRPQQQTRLSGFDQTRTGLNYKFHTRSNSPRARIGDIIVAEIWVYADDNFEFTNEGKPEPMFQVMESQHDGDLMEAIRMIGKGDNVTFVFDLDVLRKHNPGMANDGNKFLRYTIKVDWVGSEAEFEAKQERDQAKGNAEEAARLKAFTSESGITVRPNADGVYVIITTQGNGAPATRERTVAINYTGRLLNGTVFDTSLERVAREHGLYTPQRHYTPLEFQVGVGQVVIGMDNALLGMRVGTKATLIIPSNVAYGSRDQGTIPAFSTLVFDIEIVSVR